jgi:CSLREA domain-containing protein
MNHRIRRSSLLGGYVAVVAMLLTASAAAAKTYRPTRTDDPTPNGCKTKDCSLREAVIAANTAQGGKIVLRPGKRYVLTRRGAGEDAARTGDLDLLAPITVRTDGKRGNPATIDANGIDRIFEGSPTLERLILRDGHARVTQGDDGNGGAVFGDSRVRQSRFIKNTADGRGGAIYFGGGPSWISKSVFKGNKAASDGGAIYFIQACAGPEGQMGFTASRATHNSAGGDGGGIFSYCNLAVTNSYVADNSARGAGGGIFSPGTTIPPAGPAPNPAEWQSEVVMRQSTVTGNHSRSFGGGVAIDAGSSYSSISASTVSGNSTSASGGGVGLNAPAAGPAATVEVRRSTLANNTAGRDAGGIGSDDASVGFGSHATVSLDHVTVVRNRANTALESGAQRSGLGGGIYAEDNDVFSVNNTIVALNTVATQHKPQASDCANPFGSPFHSLGFNLIGNPAGCNGFGVAGDLFGGKLKLGKLAKNGGPTKTVALEKGSRAIDHADPTTTPETDQRGFRRGKKPDIGAYERGAKPPGKKEGEMSCE